MNYAFEFQDAAFTPDGRIDTPNVADHNKQVEQDELGWLRTAPERVFLYVRTLEYGRANIITWLGTVVGNAELGPEREFPCFGGFSIRRSVNVCLFGSWYYGWYYQSSGDYCRLKKAKHQ